MSTYISAIKIGTMDRHGVFDCKVTLSNTKGLSDDDMKAESDRIVKVWNDSGFDVQTKTVRNYRIQTSN